MSSSEESELIFQLRGGNVNVIEDQADEDSGEDVKILCIIWRNGKTGAAYYSILEKQLNVYEEILDSEPQFFISQSLHREVGPKFTITFGQEGDDFVKVMINTTLSGDSTATSESVKSLPPNLFLLRWKEYSFEACKSLLCKAILTENEVDQDVYLNSVLHLECKLSIHAAGALVKYLDKNWAFFAPSKDDMDFLSVQQISLKGHVLMDQTTFNALQIFQQCSHDAGFKRGMQSTSSEGLSIYRLFLSSCKSKMGQICLKNILLQPINDMSELNKRLDFVTFVLHPGHQEFVESLQDNIKNIADANMILLRIKNSRGNYRDWHALYKSIYHAIFVNELSAPYRDECDLLEELHRSITVELLGLESSISNAIDFAGAKVYGKPSIKLGLDEQLDAKKLRRQDIAKHVTAAAKIAVNQLPDYLHECSIVYLPEMGHLIAIKEWEPNCDPDQLKELGFQFMFILRGTIHYKNPMCLELDTSLGDINAEIIAHENRILERLSSFVLKYNKDIREALRILSLIDALIAIAKVSAQNNYVRPHLNNDNVHEIQECRHPLLELVSNYEPNDFLSGGNYSHIKIVTGPNGSGKSIYLKQAAVAVYFAHIGSYVPAKAANIAMVHSIHSRMQSTESACVRLSGFMIDVIQASEALHNARSNSLILLDEFGRGTVKEEGFTLLVAVLKKFHAEGRGCPHVVISTHHVNISDYIPPGPLVGYMMMAHTKRDGILSYLYKIVEGVSTSFAFDIAEEVGFDENIIRRAREWFENDTLNPLSSNCNYPTTFNYHEELIDFLQSVDIPELDP